MGKGPRSRLTGGSSPVPGGREDDPGQTRLGSRLGAAQSARERLGGAASREPAGAMGHVRGCFGGKTSVGSRRQKQHFSGWSWLLREKPEGRAHCLCPGDTACLGAWGPGGEGCAPGTSRAGQRVSA